jgi:hypothetical protein
MAVTFLVVSRNEKGSVTQTTEYAVASLAADAGQEKAKIDVLAGMLANTNPFGLGLLVPTNYINSFGFVSGNTDPTNVNYDYKSDGSAWTIADRLQNIRNLLYSGRVPVFFSNEFRYYYDANRNGRYDTNGFLPVMNSTNGFYDTNGNPIAAIQPGNTLSNFFTGDPEWIGVLERPWLPHSPTNRYISRYTYLVVPVSETLDINYIHNQAAYFKGQPPDKFGEYYRRDEGVGTWEDNFAAFLYDLNTNRYAWGDTYGYDPIAGNVNGKGFVDAFSLLQYRFAANYGNLLSVQQLFSSMNGDTAFKRDSIDGYTAGPLMLSTYLPPEGDDARVPRPWPGADNPNHFFTTQEFFDQTKVNPFRFPNSFADKLVTVGATNSSYDRYTFYRLLSQLGTDSAAEDTGKMNLNYDNLVQANPVTGARSATNFLGWHAVDFFTNAAIRLLANAGYTTGVGTTNILRNNGGPTGIHVQIYPTNLYSPAVHRLLQLAANIYDASTNRNFGQPTATNGFPSVFKPLFEKAGTNLFIVGYKEVESASEILKTTMREMNDNWVPDPTANDMVYGIPLVIGARKGLPNFNEFAMQTKVHVSRMLEFRREKTTDPETDPSNKVAETNQMYVVGISNVFGVEAWNSYSNAYPRHLQAYVVADTTAVLTNELGTQLLTNRVSRGLPAALDILPNQWSGWVNPNLTQLSFRVPLDPSTNNFMFLTNSTYRPTPGPPHFEVLNHTFDRKSGFPVPHWWLNLNARLRFILVDVDVSPNRIVDYANLDNSAATLDITAKLMEGKDCLVDPWPDNANPASQWCTNRLNDSTSTDVATYGILNQIVAGLNGAPNWAKSFTLDAAVGRDANKAVDGFRHQFNQPGSNKPLSPLYPEDFGRTFYRSNVFYAPFAPYRPIYVSMSWQANDPLVHYTINDLLDLDRTNLNSAVVGTDLAQPVIDGLGAINPRYEPWGGNPSAGSSSSTMTDLAVKDPVPLTKDHAQGRSDDWDFPTNKFPNIGWLGRVHRGTPWQTVYLKSTTITNNGQWLRWTGNGKIVTNWGQLDQGLLPLYSPATNLVGVALDSLLTQPTNDWHILELFTTAFNDNASRGQLSINQTNLAAWSAILSGVIVLTNTVPPSPLIIEPAGVYNPWDTNTWPPLVKILNGINLTRTNFPNQAFHRLGDILAVPELSFGSPALHSPYLNIDPSLLSDEVVERIPQQILSLLKGGQQPRFVVYSFGQSLKPANNSLYVGSVGGGQFFQLCTNYQITAEAATRAVIRIEGAPTAPHAVVESYNLLSPD